MAGAESGLQCLAERVNQNVVLLWSSDRFIIDTEVNRSSNFNDIKSALWAGMYEHITALTNGCIVVCDSDFVCTGLMEGNLVHFKDDRDGFAFTDFHKMLTHLMQVSEWGIRVFVNAFRCLRRS